ncbi:hypothetical protein ACKVM7_001161 [Arthrobacter russicus]|uniref:hypothetical protein n=1 Tax=Arthrobacter russicus TaxID=172040 RepID=UPI003CEBE14D
MSIAEYRTVTTKDTEESVFPAPVLLNYHMNDGYDWMDEIEHYGFGVLGVWGRDGWNLGTWPYVLCAIAKRSDEVGPLFGMATYCEGDVVTSWYRTREAHWAAITEWAFQEWKLSGNGPADLPATVEGLRDEHRCPPSLYTAGTADSDD